MVRRKNTRHLRGMTQDQAWARVVAREPTDEFLFAVETTGIYCRPSCPARRPLRENVSFFASADEAEQAGFRACRRCRPRDATLVDRARSYLDQHLDERVTLDELATAVSASPFHVQRMFVKSMGVSPRAYVERKRIERLRKSKGRTVLDAAFEAGFGSSRAVYEATAKRGVTPREQRRGGAGVEVRYAVGSFQKSRILVAATARGVCAVALGDRDSALIEELRAMLPRATLIEDRAPLRTVLDALGGRGEAKLDVAGTPFQKRVWKALQGIPAGATRTYGELARALDTSPRAVARACASNRLALLIPCHRVIGKDSALTGYRWGLDRKRALLAREADGRT